MAAAELSTETISASTPFMTKKFYFFTGTGAADNDYVTFPGLTTVEGCYCSASDGTVGLVTLATNVATITNSSTKVWSGFVWGV